MCAKFACAFAGIVEIYKVVRRITASMKAFCEYRSSLVYDLKTMRCFVDAKMRQTLVERDGTVTVTFGFHGLKLNTA